MAKPYNGHPSWNAWNVSLWVANDEGLYRLALACLSEAGNSAARAAVLMRDALGAGAKTPDGAPYSLRSLRHALAGLKD